MRVLSTPPIALFTPPATHGHSRASRLIIRAKPSDDESGVNWDEAWKRVSQNIPPVENRSTTTRTAAPPRTAPRTRQEDIKRQEQLLLNLWSDERAFLVAGASVLVVLLIFVVFVGPPPSR